MAKASPTLPQHVPQDCRVQLPLATSIAGSCLNVRLLVAHLRRLHSIAQRAQDDGRQRDKAADAGGVVPLGAAAVQRDR